MAESLTMKMKQKNGKKTSELHINQNKIVIFANKIRFNYDYTPDRQRIGKPAKTYFRQ